ncbi:isochorismatase family protein [Roseimaritima sediminicola]|uniref:isochorismatase family protein n=1 Tax=Roseimaritima sediminicola TaxID=2662066 RepID=UPI00192A2DFD|nr:isochorismatase family protein [Roseimaritima sediminicola]
MNPSSGDASRPGDAETTEALPRIGSRRVLDCGDSLLLIVDVQERLLPVVAQPQRVQHNAARLLQAASLLAVEVAVTEQYPERLGGTVRELGDALPDAYPKRAFSAAGSEPLVARLRESRKRQIVLCGIETHVCVLQSALDLLALGLDVLVVVDAVSSRGTLDHEVALQRMRDEGIGLTTTEACLFEWCRTSTDPHFKAISRLVKDG